MTRYVAIPDPEGNDWCVMVCRTREVVERGLNVVRACQVANDLNARNA